MGQIQIVEDEKLLRWALAEQLKRAGHDVRAAASLKEASEHLGSHQPDVLLLDISLPDGNGLDFYEENLSKLEDTVIIVMTAVGQVEEAVRAMKLGALDFLSKPIDHSELVRQIERSLVVHSEQREVQAARQSRERSLDAPLIAESTSSRNLMHIVDEVADSQVDTLLLQGESGTGKNVLARHIHSISNRWQKPIMELSCAAVPDTLIESELFGHERGAFTDAKSTRRGVFELADGGTVVLDEIGELKLELQSKLLHVLEERRLRRVGGTREIRIDVRVIGLTNRDLTSMAQGGSFRQDLFFRLNIFPITVPPLRERPEDILPLARLFLDTLQPKLGRDYKGFSHEAENALLAYSWPGNIRELRNVVERAMILDRTDQIQAKSLILNQFGSVASSASSLSAPELRIMPLHEMEHQLIEKAMSATGDNQTRAAELLGITRDQLRYRLKKLDRDSS